MSQIISINYLFKMEFNRLVTSDCVAYIFSRDFYLGLNVHELYPALLCNYARIYPIGLSVLTLLIGFKMFSLQYFILVFSYTITLFSLFLIHLQYITHFMIIRARLHVLQDFRNSQIGLDENFKVAVHNNQAIKRLRQAFDQHQKSMATFRREALRIQHKTMHLARNIKATI